MLGHLLPVFSGFRTPSFQSLGLPWDVCSGSGKTPSHALLSQPGSLCSSCPHCSQGNLGPRLGDTSSPSLGFKINVFLSERLRTVTFLTPSFSLLLGTSHKVDIWPSPPTNSEISHVLLNSAKDLNRIIRPYVTL